jgi:hypothetical protein
LSLRIGFYHHATKVRNLPVNFGELLLPPSADIRIQRIERLQATDLFGHADIHCKRKLHAVGTKCLRNARKLRNEIGIENMKIGVHVVDDAPIDAD